MFSSLSRKQRLTLTIAISLTFFLAELAVGFYTKSLAVIADAFHYMNDLIGFIIALVALVISERKASPPVLSFGWQRSQLLGAFFNGVFLLALGVSIFLQAVERFVSVQRVDNPKVIFIIGVVGLVLNITSVAILHEHHHQTPPVPSTLDDGSLTFRNNALTGHAQHRHTLTRTPATHRDLGMLGVLVHVAGDAINNIGVIIAALVMWLSASESRFYADPGASLVISILILVSSLPLVKSSGTILLQGAPQGLSLEDVKHDLEQIDGVVSVHELHIWQLDQRKSIASAHVVISELTIDDFMTRAKTITECLHEYGVHSVTLQPERPSPQRDEAPDSFGVRQRKLNPYSCRITCGSSCDSLTCCD